MFLVLYKVQDTKYRDIGYNSCSQEILSPVGEKENKCLNSTQFGDAVAGHSLGALGGYGHLCPVRSQPESTDVSLG